MVSYGSQKGTKSTTTPVFKYLPGQEAYLPQYAQTWQDIFSGNLTSPAARMLQTTVGEAGMREAATQRSAISGTRGMSTPAKQRAVAGVGETAVKTMAGVPQEMWSKAAEYLSQYTLAAPAVGQVSRTTGGGGTSVGCCFIFLEGMMLNDIVRRYRDEHFPKLTSSVSLGYRWMASWLVPLMKESKLVKWAVKVTMLKPLACYAAWYYGENSFGWIYAPIKWFWISRWEHYGMREVI